MLEAKRRAAVFFILAFILAAATGYMVLQKVEDLNSDLGKMTKVYVANADIPSRTVITENQITVMELPNKFITDSHVTSFNDLENQVSVVPLTEGDMITQNMIKPASNLQDENNRLVTLHRTEKVQFDQVIEALDRVDIIVSTNDNGKRSTSVFMKDVVVRFSEGAADKFAGVAVEVTAEQAPKLIHMQNYAEHIRILKANVGQNSLPPEEETEEQATQEKTPTETKTEEKPVTPPKEKAVPKEAPKAGTTSGSGQ
jgi:Flp pilus assembly protein CpaB